MSEKHLCLCVFVFSWLTFLNPSTVFPSSTSAQSALASCAYSLTTGTLHVQDPTNTAQKLSSSDSNPPLSECAPVVYRFPRRDQKCNRLVSSDEFRASVSTTPADPKRECQFGVVAQRNHSPQVPPRLSSHRRSNDRCSSKSYRPHSGNPIRALLQLKSQPSPVRSSQMLFSRTETDPRRLHLSELHPSRVGAFLLSPPPPK